MWKKTKEGYLPPTEKQLKEHLGETRPKDERTDFGLLREEIIAHGVRPFQVTLPSLDASLREDHGTDDNLGFMFHWNEEWIYAYREHFTPTSMIGDIEESFMVEMKRQGFRIVHFGNVGMVRKWFRSHKSWQLDREGIDYTQWKGYDDG